MARPHGARSRRCRQHTHGVRNLRYYYYLFIILIVLFSLRRFSYYSHYIYITIYYTMTLHNILNYKCKHNNVYYDHQTIMYIKCVCVCE